MTRYRRLRASSPSARRSFFLVSYLGLNPRVRQSGLGFARHGRISMAGHMRAMLVEAVWAAAKAPAPFHALFLRVRAGRGQQIAAVAVARRFDSSSAADGLPFRLTWPQFAYVESAWRPLARRGA